jgi:hypothetical protein
MHPSGEVGRFQLDNFSSPPGNWWRSARRTASCDASNKFDNLVTVLREARTLLAWPDNDFSWSSWEDTEAAIREIDELRLRVESGSLPPRLELEVLFAPTGPIQEVSISSGWGQVFLRLADRFDAAAEDAYGRLRKMGS